MKSNQEKKWACFSFTSLFAFCYLTLFILLEMKFDYYSWSIAVVSNTFILPIGAIFLHATAYDKRFWKFWKPLPKIMHQIITALCLFWVILLAVTVLPITLRKGYEKK